MNVSVVLNWRSFLAIGAGTALVIMALKLNSDATEHVMVSAAGICKTQLNSAEEENG